MYGIANTVPQVEKNPNRVAGGLRAQGADHYIMLGEDGSEQRIPSQKYVQALEEKLKMQDAKIHVLEKKIKNITAELSSVANNQRLTFNEIQKNRNL